MSWKKVYETPQAYRAEIVKAKLEEHQIPAMVVDKQDDSYLFGLLEVWVHPDMILKAIKLIEDEISFV